MPSSETTYLVLDIETIPDRELFTPPEPTGGHGAPLPAPLRLPPGRPGGDVAGRHPGRATHRHVRRGERRGRDDGRLRGFHGEMAPAGRSPGTAAASTCPCWRCAPCGSAWTSAGTTGAKGYRYRFSEEGHLDLCDVISDHGAAKMTSLDGASRTIGLPGKDGVDGSQVEGLVQRRAARGAATLLPVRRGADRVPVPALPAGGRGSRARRIPPRGHGPAGGARDRRTVRAPAGRGRSPAGCC